MVKSEHQGYERILLLPELPQISPRSLKPEYAAGGHLARPSLSFMHDLA